MITVTMNFRIGVVTQDANVSTLVSSWIADEVKDITVGSEMLVNEFRLRVIKGDIPHDGIQFVHEDGTVATINECGVLSSWGGEEYGVYTQIITNILKGGGAIRRRMREERLNEKEVHNK